jgi:hypothetical protein
MDGTNGETEGKQRNGTNGTNGTNGGQMEDKWTDKWTKWSISINLARMGQMGERILYIRSHLSRFQMPEKEWGSGD